MRIEQALRVLGLDYGYTEDDLKKAYRQMAKMSHPDIKKDDGREFKLVSEAYKLLKNTKGNTGGTSVFGRGSSEYLRHGKELFSYEYVK